MVRGCLGNKQERPVGSAGNKEEQVPPSYLSSVRLSTPKQSLEAWVWGQENLITDTLVILTIFEKTNYVTHSATPIYPFIHYPIDTASLKVTNEPLGTTFKGLYWIGSSS